MTFLVEEESGMFRTHEEGVYDGDKIIFMCPTAELVPSHMENFLEWLNESRDVVHSLILSSVFHYEFVFIHPFGDGNGRMARLWQTAILSKWEEAFEYIPIESLIKKYQDDYYDAISRCNGTENSNEFIEFMLKMIDETVSELLISTIQETTQEKLIFLIKENPNITQEQLAVRLGLTRDGVSYNIKKLRIQGKIERIGSTKSGIWIIK